MRTVIVVLLLLTIYAPGAAGDQECTADLAAGYCAEADADVGLDCTAANGTYRCVATASYAGSGSSGGGAPAELRFMPARLEIGVCAGPGLCQETEVLAGTPCAWPLGSHGCGDAGNLTEVVTGSLSGCLYAWATMDVRVSVRDPVAGRATFAQDQAWVTTDFDSCNA